VDISVVIPVYNEEDSLHLLHKALHAALDNQWFSWEAVLVDDGSKDRSLEVLEELAVKDPEHMVVVAFRRNFGQTAAMSAGIDYALGEVIVLMDADLQNDPADIPMMLEKMAEGYDVVSGWREHRKDDLSRTFPSRIANALISKVTGVPLHDYGCSLKAYRRDVITGFRLYGEMHRFIPAFANAIGARITEVPVRHHPRQFGKAKYGLERIGKVILDLFAVKFLTCYANKPIYLFGGTGLGMIGASVVILIGLIINRMLGHSHETHLVRSPLLYMSMMLFILGFQCILLGLVAELLARTYHESQDKKSYTVRKVIRRNVVE